MKPIAKERNAKEKELKIGKFPTLTTTGYTDNNCTNK